MGPSRIFRVGDVKERGEMKMRGGHCRQVLDVYRDRCELQQRHKAIWSDRGCRLVERDFVSDRENESEMQRVLSDVRRNA